MWRDQCCSVYLAGLAYLGRDVLNGSQVTVLHVAAVLAKAVFDITILEHQTWEQVNVVPVRK